MVRHSDPLLLLPNTFRPFYGAFSHLRPMQTDAIVPILDGRDLIVQAATGSGKSEAVLAPALERLIASGRTHGIIYLIPTRALAKDLVRRFEPVIVERLGLGLAIRTGDRKRGGKKRPDIMFTTPESLDVMLGSANANLKSFLFRVGTVIIDEVHPLVHHYRGRHLTYLFTRLERKTGTPLQKIAMSATIARITEVMEFFSFRPDSASIIATADRRIRARLLHLKNEDVELPALLNDLYREWGYRKILIFCNSRSACDRLSGIVRRTGVFRTVTELHYSNLKPRERIRAEDRFRKNSHALCIATSTLELGIDVGDVDAVLLFGPPGSVSSFLQRIGRANRRGDAINFWGISSGENAGIQVVRFLALLELGRKGKIETPSPKQLPSVLSQQIISCLYEKKQISLKALQDLFPAQKERVADLFSSLGKTGWLKPEGHAGLIRGGWKYGRFLMDHKIWGNFPETEKEYLLEVCGESVADIPQSIVSQMEPGDRVFLSGRRLQILSIEDGDPGKVTAAPTMEKDEKKLAWAGLGAHVSYETARAMGRILRSGTAPDESGLMARTRQLFQNELAVHQKRVRLANGIEVVPGTRARFRFCTFLGSAGNLVLEWVIRDHFQDEDLIVSSNETGVECSQWIAFETLDLPVARGRFNAWVSSRFRVLSSLIPLNIFWKDLPRERMREEVTDFLYDARVAGTFARYLESRSDIVSGDMADLAGPLLSPSFDETKKESPAFQMAVMADLLETERQQLPPLADSPFSSPPWQNPCLCPDEPDAVKPLTATMVSEYFFFGQCSRRFCLTSLGPDRPADRENDFPALAREQGIRHEQAVLVSLEARGQELIMPEPAMPGISRRSASVEIIRETVARLAACDPKETRPIWLSQCYLAADRLTAEFPTIKAVGIPDLLKCSATDEGRVLIQAGDIKRSRGPGYHHKWQVAFYALVLKIILDGCHIPARVSGKGFIMTPPSQNGPEPADPYNVHEFDLKPFLASFSMLLHRLGDILSHGPDNCGPGDGHRLDHRCPHCAVFSHCYREALAKEEILFLPMLTPGELAALRRMGCATMAQAREALEKEATPFFPAQRKKLAGWCDAFLEKCIRLHTKKTHDFPANLSRLFFIHLETDPLDSRPRVLGWLVRDAADPSPVDFRIWTMETRQERQAVWQIFVQKMEQFWADSIYSGLGPHIFHFGSQSRKALLQWADDEDRDACRFLHQAQPAPWTDLQTVLTAHFYMPAPGIPSLYALDRIFGCDTGIEAPATLFHQNRPPQEDAAAAAGGVQTRLTLMAGLYETAASRLESQWIKEWPEQDRKNMHLLPYITFIEEESRLKAADIMMLRDQPLAERMLRFRSMGYLKFLRTRLDHEGRFLHIFTATSQTLPAKFRQGDFLKLVPHGMADIQGGLPVILASHDLEAGEVGLLSRSGRIQAHKEFFYSLEEEMEDWNRDKLRHAAETLVSGQRHLHLRQMLAGRALERRGPASRSWVEQWLASDDRGLNKAQRQALKLPFHYRTAMIQGPPGTGKTHLLGWIIISLILEAHDAGKPLRIGISALTHQAIDTVLKKVAQLAGQYLPDRFPGQCVKWGEAGPVETAVCTGEADDAGGEPESGSGSSPAVAVEYTTGAHDLPARPWLVLGATGYGFYSLFKSKDKGFPLALDWMIFDEASQVPVPQALLSLMYARGNFLFLGDVNQLPPIVMGDYGADENSPCFNNSILSNIRDLYPDHHRKTLNITYRMNRGICEFPSKTWYNNELFPAPEVADARLNLPRPDQHYRQDDENEKILGRILNPEQPVVLVLTDHRGCAQQSHVEADLICALVRRLITGHGLSPDRMAVITPHRAQNNAVTERLGKHLTAEAPDRDRIRLPLVDTVERIQGAERDVILFGLTVSDPDHLHNPFINSPNRLNVAMTRARKKLIIIGSQAFFSMLPRSESLLAQNACFKLLLAHCRAKNAVFYWHTP